MKKAFDQTVRDLKRGVNKKVLKVPGVEQKVLDATNNESWGPHGTLLADIAQATRNYHDYQMIMHVIWKRINDTGKNWRHVYKALIVLEYLVAHGSERVIEDIKEHGYQISILADFQYVDSSGRDQGSNVRRKSQSLVALVNDKERVQEIRQKNAANKDKYGNAPSNGRPGGYGDHFVDDRSDNRYTSRDEERYGNGKERQMGYRDGDRSSRDGRDGAQDGGFSEERHGRDNDLRGQGKDGYQYGSKNRNLSRNRSFDDDDCYSSRSDGGSRADDLPQEERQLERRHSEQRIGAPPSYEEATRDAQSHVQEDRNGDDFTADAPKASPPKAISPSEITNPSSTPFAPTDNSPKIAEQGLGHVPAGVSSLTSNNENNCFDEFDPRGSSASVAPPVANNQEMDLFGSDPIYSLALTSTTNGAEVDLPANSGPGTGFEAMPSASGVFGQPGENPFGDPPFEAIQENYSYREVSFGPVTTFNSSISTGGAEVLPTAANTSETTTGFDFDLYFGVANNPVLDGQQNSFVSTRTSVPEAPGTQQNDNNLGMLTTRKSMEDFVSMQETRPAATLHVHGNHLPQSAPPAPFASQETQFAAQGAPTHIQGNVVPQSSPPALQATQYSTQDATAHMQGNFLSQSSLPAPFTSQAAQFASQDAPTNLQGNFLSQSGPPAPFASQGTEFTTKEPHANQYTSQDTSTHVQGNLQSHSGPPAPFAPQATQFTGQDARTYMQGTFLSQSGRPDPFASYSSQFAAQDAPTHMQRNFLSQSGPPAPFASQPTQFTTKEAPTHVQGNLLPYSSPPAPFASQATQFTPQNGAAHIQGNHLIQSGPSAPFASQATQFTAQNTRSVTPVNNQIPQLNLLSQPGLQTSPTLEVPDQMPVLQHVKTAPPKEKFEPKSTVWADTLSRGLVNLNISGPKTNPHADIGIDFDSMNRKEKMKEEKKISATPVSTVTMGKAMGSGSGIGRAGATALAAPQNSMMGSGMAMGMGMGTMGGGGGMGMGMMGGAGMGMGMGMGGYGGNMGQPMGMGMNMGMTMGMNQGMPQRPLMGVPPGPNGMPGYNPMMGIGNFGSQQPYGSGYR